MKLLILIVTLATGSAFFLPKQNDIAEPGYLIPREKNVKQLYYIYKWLKAISQES
jgi:hypothetical protein